MKRTIFLFILIVSSNLLFAQNEEEKKQKLTLSGYVDSYYSYFSDSVGRNNLQQFTTVGARSGQIGLNTAQLTASYEAEKVRGNLTLHYGDIALATWSEEYLIVQEANAGIRLAKDWWLDAGFFTTHLGTESFLPKDNLLSSTTVITYNEPFYQAGARVCYEGSDKLEAQVWVLNGYNQFLDKNDAKSYGLYLSYALSDDASLTYTNIVGNEAPAGWDIKQYRVYQNVYLDAALDKWHVIVGGDLGVQSNSSLDKPNEAAWMYNALFTTRYQFTPEFSVTGRAELFQDKNGFISGTYATKNFTVEGLQLYGLTLGTEYRPSENAYLRLETRYIQTDDKLEIFTTDQEATNKRVEVLATLGFTFDKVFKF